MIVYGEDECGVNGGVDQDKHMPFAGFKCKLILFLRIFARSKLTSAIKKNICHLRGVSLFKHYRPIFKDAAMVPVGHENRPKSVISGIIGGGWTIYGHGA